MGHRYKLITTGKSSSHYGPCEICNKPASEIFHQIEEREYPGGWTQHKCHNLFGHKTCLELKQKAQAAINKAEGRE